MVRWIAGVVLGLLLLHEPAGAKIYQWTDEKGGVVFSNQPPPAARAASSSPAGVTSRARSFPLPRHGTLILSLPESWDQEVRQAPEGVPPTIVLTPREGDDFEVLITPFWDPENRPDFNSPQVAKSVVDGDLARMLPGAVEREVKIREIQGTSRVGYYFFVTDKAPGSGYPYAVRADIGVGDLLLHVTVLCRTKDSDGVLQTILALEGAVHRKS
jgi:hypothetical protein